ncbi:MAG: hypothetical protein IH623_24810 [Verrucomicrobia bacterium]|nr:hypothetical protein [Verrucomicrobiota bacterium]
MQTTLVPATAAVDTSAGFCTTENHEKSFYDQAGRLAGVTNGFYTQRQK